MTESEAEPLFGDQGDDFLGGDEAHADLAGSLLKRRREIAQWAAAALISRHPHVASYRGHKGVLACEQDLDFHLQHLHESVYTQAPETLQRYAAWIVAVLGRRGVPPTSVVVGVQVLGEALLRFMPHPAGTELRVLLWDAFGL